MSPSLRSFTCTGKNGENQENITLDLITEEDTENVGSFLKAHFYKDEPLCTFLEMDENKDLGEFSTKFIPQHCSFKAVNSEGQIVGVLMNGIINRPDPNEPQQPSAEKCESPKFRKVLQLMDYVDTQFNIFALYPDINAVLDVSMMSVSPKYRGYGLTVALINKTMAYMREQNIPLMHVLCTSFYSARLLEKLDFQNVYCLPYSEFLTDGGEQVLIPEAPHLATNILVKRV